MPYNSEIRSTVYTYNHVDKNLEPFRNMKVHKYIDSEGNRALMMHTLDIPFHGEEKFNVYVDLNENRLVRSAPEIDFCLEDSLGTQKITIRNMIDDFKTEGGSTEYLGLRAPRWETATKYHALRLNIDIKELKGVSVYFFDQKTLELVWIEAVSPLPFVIEIENGLVERRFTDKDFKGVLLKCPKKEGRFF